MQFRAKKSLGQNFLKSKEALGAIVAAGALSADDIILEVGPGKGVLTERLVTLAKKVIAIEKDRELIALLNEKLAAEIASGKLEIIEGDILEFDETKMKAYGSSYKLIANIPYYITGALIRKFLESPFQPSRMVLMLQKEVAQRIVARDGKESLLSIAVKAYGTPHYVQKVAARYFSPEPAVDSAIISIEDISKDFFNDISETAFFSLIRRGFAHKRKKVSSNIGTDQEKITSILEKRGFTKMARPEELPIAVWKEFLL